MTLPRTTSRFLLPLLMVVGLAGIVSGQPSPRKVVVAGEEPQLAARLQAVDRLLDPLDAADMVAHNVGHLAGPLGWLQSASFSLALRSTPERWEQALEEYERLVQEADGALVPGSATARLASAQPSTQARRAGHYRLTRLPPALLENYRRRVDGAARRLLEEGKSNRDSALLRRLVDEMFCSRPAEHALELLGDLAFERGQFAEASSWWGYLAGPGHHRNDSAPLLFPDPRGVPLIRAKLILAMIFQGETHEADQELLAFKTIYPRPHGRLAGLEGPLADILDKVRLDAAERHFFQNDQPWTTFAGDPSRQRTLQRPLHPRLWCDGPTWRVTLPGASATAMPALLGHARQPAFHPIVAGSQVLLADARSVYSYHLLTGKLLWQYEPKEFADEQPEKTARTNVAFAPLHTLSAWGDRLFVRLGKQRLGVRNNGAEGGSYLVCLDLNEGNGPLPRELWKIRAEASYHFEGSPLVVEDRVYIAQTKVAAPRAQTSLACFDAATGRRRWLWEACESFEFDEGSRPRPAHHLLTLAGTQLVYCSHAGVVLAVDPWSGRRLWALRYPSRGQITADGSPSPRSLAPCIHRQDRLYVAPLDSNRILCLDAASGSILWEREGIETVHLLGIAGEHLLIATTTGVQAIHARTGTDRGGWLQPSVGKLPSHGRALLAGGWIFWPTQDPQLPYRALQQSDGSQEAESGISYEPTQLRGLVPGNMVFGQDCLVIAGTRELVAYVPQRRLLDSLRQTRDRSPADLYRFAQALADAGQDKQAAEALTALSQRGKDWKTLADRRRQELAPDEAKRSAAASSWTQLRDRSGNPPDRIDAVMKKAVRPPQPAQRPAGPLTRRWEHGGEQLLPGVRSWNEDFVLTRAGSRLGCRDIVTGKPRWSQELLFEPCWVGCQADVILVAGHDGIQANRLDDGAPLWSFPGQLFRSAHLEGDRPALTRVDMGLDDFHLGTGVLHFRRDGRRLFAVDLDKGQVRWTRWAPGGELRPLRDGGRFVAAALLGDKRILTQTNDGKRLLLDSATGRTIFETVASAWSGPPLDLGSGRVCLAAAGGQVALLDLDSGRELWRYAYPWSTSLTGAAPQLVAQGDVLLALVPVNYGQELLRLDVATGKALWPEPVLLRDELDLATACLCGSEFYCSIHDEVRCHSLTDGKLLWQRTLSDQARRRQLELIGDTLLAYPADPVELPWLPTGPALTYPLVRSLSLPTRKEFAVWILDRRDGSPLQQLAPGHAPGKVVVSPHGLVIGRDGTLMGYSASP